MASRRPRRLVSYYRLPGSSPAAALREAGEACSRFARSRGAVVLEPFVESGPRLPQLARALERCQESAASLLVPQLAACAGERRFLEAVLAARVPLLAADAGSVRPATLRLLLSVARYREQERGARSRAALREARRRGARLGSPRPEVGSRAGVASLRAAADAHAAKVAGPLAELLLSNPGASLRDLADGLNGLGVPTARGGRWAPSGVRNVLARAQLEGLWRGGGRRASQLT